MPRPWTATPATLEAWRASALRRQLWTQAQGRQTGARTDDGKKRAAMRALQHGIRSTGGIALGAWLASVNRALRRLTMKSL
jgi:hypothetical protein